MGRRRPNSPRHPTGQDRKRLLARPHRHPTSPLPASLLHLTPDQVPANRKPNLLQPRPPQRTPLQADNQRTPPRRNLHPHLRPAQQQNRHRVSLPNLRLRTPFPSKRPFLDRSQSRDVRRPGLALTARFGRPLRPRQRRYYLAFNHFSQRRDSQFAESSRAQGVFPRDRGGDSRSC